MRCVGRRSRWKRVAASRLSDGLDVADEFLRRHLSPTSETLDDQRYWDIVTVLDLVAEIDPSERAPFALARLERYLESVLSG
jgi:hypothetical protein